MISIVEKLGDISKMNTISEACFAYEDPKLKLSNPYISCPYWMHSKLNDYKNAGWIIDSPKKMCNVDLSFNNDPFNTYKDLEYFLATNEQTSVSAPVDMFSSCLQNTNTIEGEESFSDKELKLLVTEYYSRMNRIKASRLAAIETIASIDSVLGSPPKSDEFWSRYNSDCDDKHFIDTVKMCDFYKNSCKPKGGLEDLSSEIKEAYEYLNILEKSDATQEEKSKLRSAIVGLYPWLEGDEFKKSLKKSGMNFTLSLKNQLLKSREKNIEKMAEFKLASSCLNSHVKDPNKCNGLESTIKKTQPHTILVTDKDPDEYLKALFAKGHQDTLKCVEDIKKQRDFSDSAIKDFAIDSALTVSTIGLGAAVSATKASVGVTKSISTLGKLSNAAKRSLAVLKTPKGLVYTALAGIDSFRGMSSISESIVDACSSKLSNTNIKIDNSLSCPKEIGNNVGTNTTTDYRKCAFTGLISAVSLTIPYTASYAGKVVKKLSDYSPVFSQLAKDDMKVILSLKRSGVNIDNISISEAGKLTDKQRQALAQYYSLKISGKALSEEQVKSVLDAHKVGKSNEFLGSYSRSSIAKKSIVLAEAGVEKELRKTLFDNGIAGQAISLEKIVKTRSVVDRKILELKNELSQRTLSDSEQRVLKEHLLRRAKLDELSIAFEIDPDTLMYKKGVIDRNITRLDESINKGSIDDIDMKSLVEQKKFWLAEKSFGNQKNANNITIEYPNESLVYGGSSYRDFNSISSDQINTNNATSLGGRSNALKVRVNGNLSVVIKKASSDGVSVDREVAAFSLDKDIFGLGVVVPTKKVSLNGEDAVVGQYISNSVTDDVILKRRGLSREESFYEDEKSVNALNYIYGNRDFTSENVLNVIDKSNVTSRYAIDFSDGFGRYRSKVSDGVYRRKGELNQMSKDVQSNPSSFTPNNKDFIKRIKTYSSSIEGKRKFFEDVRSSLEKSGVSLPDESIENMYDRMVFLSSQF